MTGGSEEGTSGREAYRVGPWSIVALVAVAVAFVNATSGIMERDSAYWWGPVVWEATSAVVVVAIAPFIGWAIRRWPPRADNLPSFVLIQIGLTIPFSLAHVLAIFVLREAIYWMLAARYGFFDDGVGVVVLYEWRKDVLTYAAIAAVYWFFQLRAERPPPTRPGESRVEIRDGGGVVFLRPDDILLVEAAGNYITFNTAARNYLVRGTLAAWEARLAEHGFARVHRSRLVNRARIRALKPTPSGDVEITLDDGRTVLGSRRYREALAEPSTGRR